MASKLRSLAETDVRHPIPPEQLLPALQTPPFIYVPGTFNTRDLGLLADDNDGSGSAKIRRGFIYRTGGLDILHGSLEGRAALREKLGVRRIFDLRSKDEHARSPDPEIEGIEGVWLGSEGTTEQAAKVDLAAFIEGEGEKGYVAMYFEVLDWYQGIFREVLRSIRDRPQDPIMFHCTAGRDRTGVLAGMLETIAGYDPKLVQTDFLLSRIGYEPAREQLIKFAIQGAGVDVGEKPDLSRFYDVPGFLNLAALKTSCWDAFVDAVREKYGGFEGYVTGVLGFSDEDLIKIRRNLVQAP
ncbi:hypothetical protein M406DRAFT_334634 [Cryphonectria parasitica EP155]|uniref:Tyrosine specific protein phosphatases domain-containing protein n=1 Tax=Cryphonectria parasitica (strain ATCC 38755 / EP155) TaxID=660469 RepID=A0A9P4XTG4_CRYP1|nr:uncharacterized protein M406DRAFT_334634 [Cryphonectria parasitica EP155]KAF3761019.1 hypothetical protein M406DRAFT_334634 [Cryphonectria parasitica EP155]